MLQHHQYWFGQAEPELVSNRLWLRVILAQQFVQLGRTHIVDPVRLFAAAQQAVRSILAGRKVNVRIACNCVAREPVNIAGYFSGLNVRHWNIAMRTGNCRHQLLAAVAG
ncbi:MAG: hypothetical protein JW388_0320 [Nitrospira sp.]|nr:hypothetical protein [Nitrospira sp.]